MAEPQLPDVVPVSATKSKQDYCYPDKVSTAATTELKLAAVSVIPNDTVASTGVSLELKESEEGSIDTEECASGAVSRKDSATSDTKLLLWRYHDSRMRLGALDTEASKPHIRNNKSSEVSYQHDLATEASNASNEVSYHRDKVEKGSSDESPATTATSATIATHPKTMANRLSLDDRLIGRRNTRPSIDEGSVATRNLPHSATCSSCRLPSFTKSASDNSFWQTSRRSSFGSEPNGSVPNGSTVRGLHLAVPQRFAGNQWGNLGQCGKHKRRSTFSQLGSMSSFNSRSSLTKSISSAGSRRYLRFDRSPGAEPLSAGRGWDLRTLGSSSSGEASPPSQGLTLTQLLAFPGHVTSIEQLHKDRFERRDGFLETESNFNFFAKIITFLVLVFAVVLIVGYLTKFFHSP